MSIFFILGIYLLLFLFGDGERVGWNRFLHDGSVEDDSDNYDVSILTGLTTWRLLFPDDDIKAEMVSPPWNNFLRSLLRFIVVRSGHDEGPGKIRFRLVFLILRWQKEEVSQLHLHECWPSFVWHLFSGLLPSVCLYGHPYCKVSWS